MGPERPGPERADRWEWGASFAEPAHIAVLRAAFGTSTSSGVPTAYRWEVLPPRARDGGCDSTLHAGEGAFVPIVDASEARDSNRPRTADVRATRRSWFVDVDACAVRIVIEASNGPAPVLRDVAAFEGARDLLRAAASIRSADGDAVDDPTAAIDGGYASGWRGAPGKREWALDVRLPHARAIDRVRLVLGEDATSAPAPGGPRAIGRRYRVARGPVRYVLEGSDDGDHFTRIATTPLDRDGSPLPLRRRLIVFPARRLDTLRLTMTGATGDDGAPDERSAPMVRQIEAFAADDPSPVIPSPWVLSVNANPAGVSHGTPGGELANDVFYAKFLQQRFVGLLPALRRDDRFARALGPRGELLDAKRSPEGGAVLESIEGEDPALPGIVAGSSPPPIVALSGSNSWEYAGLSGPDPRDGTRWEWNPLLDAAHGGMGGLAAAVHDRAAPFIGFCGGAQILALLEATRTQAHPRGPTADHDFINALLRRTTGRRIDGFYPTSAVERAWPGESRPQVEVAFDAEDPLFVDLTGPRQRHLTHAFPESHADVIRPDAFLPSGPLHRLALVARSVFCGPSVVAGGPHDPAFPNPSGPGHCVVVPEAFRSRGDGYPMIGTQFHPEQRDFEAPYANDPVESIADARLFIAAAYESVVDAYVRLAPR